MQPILDILNTVPGEVWSLIVEILFSAIIVSPVALGLKKFWKVNSEKIMLFLVIAGSFAAATFTYLQGSAEFAPWVIAVEGWLVFATTQPVYFLFIKPLTRRVGSWFAAQVAEATLLNEAKTAAVPEQGLPEQPDTVLSDINVRDFSN